MDRTFYYSDYHMGRRADEDEWTLISKPSPIMRFLETQIGFYREPTALVFSVLWILTMIAIAVFATVFMYVLVGAALTCVVWLISAAVVSFIWYSGQKHNKDRRRPLTSDEAAIAHQLYCERYWMRTHRFENLLFDSIYMLGQAGHSVVRVNLMDEAPLLTFAKKPWYIRFDMENPLNPVTDDFENELTPEMFADIIRQAENEVWRIEEAATELESTVPDWPLTPQE